jgi:hypothetical protein
MNRAEENGTLRYLVPSDERAGVKYTVELEHYGFNGACSCPDFRMNLERHLRRGITPAEAVARGLVKLKKRQRPADALRCKHIVDAFMQFAVTAARLVHSYENKHQDPYDVE